MALFAYGPCIVSAPFELDLPLVKTNEAPAVELKLVVAHEHRSWLVERDHAFGGGVIQNWRSVQDAAYRLRFAFDDHAADFVIAPHGRTVDLVATPATPRHHLAWLFEGPVLGRALRLAGRPCLHATVLARDEKAIAVLGPSGAGKSTLAAALLPFDAALFGDDMAVAQASGDAVLTYPGNPRLRLWGDSLPHAGTAERTAVLPGVTSVRKLAVKIDQPRAVGPRRLHAVYRLAPRHRGDRAVTRRLPPPAASAVLAANIYGALPHDPARAKSELTWAAALASRVTVTELSLPDDHAALVRLAPELAVALFA